MKNADIKILVVDDDAILRESVAIYLEDSGYQVTQAENGKLALQRLEEDSPDLMLLDLRMPVLGGFAVLSALENKPEFPVIVISGAGDLDSAIEALRSGGWDYITKPIHDFTLLEHSIQRALEQARLRRENRHYQENLEEEVEKRSRELRKAQQALLAANTHLEEKVAERTSELEYANRELLKMAKLKDEFLASVSHELRNPLNAILGGTEILEDGYYGPLNEKQSRVIERISQSGEHLLGLINDILDISKTEAGKLTIDRKQISLPNVCEVCLNLVKESAVKKNIRLKTSFDPEVPVIYADQKRLKQILLNLLSNALKFTPQDGTVTLSYTKQKKENRVVISVKDTGIGIAKDMMDKLFKPFVQLDSSLARHYEGTGLGLALVKNLTDLHNGSIELKSTPNEGSCFSVILPLQTNPPAADTAQQVRLPDTQEESLPEGKNIRVLLVEDNPDNRETLSEYLRFRGCQVSAAGDGVEGIRQAYELHPDIILMDIQMPGMDGLEAIRRLRADDSFKKTPIVALTALVMPGDKQRCLTTGADSYLSKPVSLRNLMTVVKQLTGTTITAHEQRT